MSDNLNLDQILDGTIDDLKDMPSNKPFPSGMHKCKLDMELKVIKEDENNKPIDVAIEFKLTYMEVVELANPNETPPAVGDETTTLYFLKHSNPKTVEMGQGQFKEHLKSLAEHFGPKSVRDMIETANGSTVIAMTGIRHDKKTKRDYTELKAITVE